MELASEEEYEAAVAWLAQDLLETNSPEQLAVFAAQHRIYLDALNSRDEARRALILRYEELIQVKDQQLQEMDLKNAVLTRKTARIAKIVLDAKGKKTARSGGRGKAINEEKIKRRVLEDWTANRSAYRSVQDFANKRCDEHCRAATTIAGWVYAHEKLKRTEPNP